MAKQKPKAATEYSYSPANYRAPNCGHTWYSADFGVSAESSEASDKHDGLGAFLPKKPSMRKKIFDALSGELTVVLLIGLVSTTTAWTAIQASFHGGASDAAYGDYQTSMAEANNLWITAEVKYRADLLTWDTEIGGSYEYDVYAQPCRESGGSQLPDCQPYMDAVYTPYSDAWNSAQPLLDESEVEGGYSNRLQVLTGIFAVALFGLGVTSPMKSRKHASYLVAFSAILWATGIGLMVTIPIILL
jgi:hypothetical protein